MKTKVSPSISPSINKNIIPCDKWKEGEFGNCKNCGFSEYRHFDREDLYDGIDEIEELKDRIKEIADYLINQNK